MKFGMPTMVDCTDIVECCQLAKENNLDFVEINMSFPQYNYSGLSVEMLSDLKKKYGVFYTIHADEMLNPFDFNKEVSDCYFSVMRNTIRFAKALEIPVINMHLLKGVYTTLPDRVVYLNDVYKKEYLDKVSAFVKMCEEEIGGADLKIAIENVDSNPFTPSQIDALPIFMRSNVFALTLDIGHLLCLEKVDAPVFEKHKNKLYHLHLHDSDAKYAHLPLGTALLDVKKLLTDVSYVPTCLIEVKNPEGLRQSVSHLKERNLI